MRKIVLAGGALVAAAIVSWWLFGREVAPPPPPTVAPPAPVTPAPAPLASASAVPERAAPPSATPTPTPTPTKALPPPPPVGAKSPLRGLGTRELTAADRQLLNLPEKLWGGVVVTAVDPTSPAAEARLESGDVIYRAGGAKIMAWDDLARAIGEREQTRIQVYRGGQAFEVVLQRPFVPPEGQ